MTDEANVIYQIITNLIPTILFLYIFVPFLLISLAFRLLHNPDRY